MMDGILKQEATSAVDTAILLTSAGVLASGGAESEEAIPSPLTRVGGLTLFQRAVLTLQRGGISQIWVLAGREEPALRELLREDSRLQAAVRWLPVREFPPHDPQTWETLADEVSGACMVVGCHTVFSHLLIQRLRHEGSQGKAVVVVGQPDEGYFRGNPGVVVRPEWLDGQALSAVLFQDGSHTSALDSNPAANTGRLPIVGDLLVLPGRLLGISGTLHANGTNPLRLALEQAAVEGMVHVIPGEMHWFRDVRGPKGVKLAEQTLVRSLQAWKGGLNGIVDHYVNRKCSGPLTRLFLKLRWTPNTITVVSMLIGLVAAGFFIPGSWEFALIGALLFQLSVIIDCCDGEVARLTFSVSKFGQELDLWADNVVHMSIFSGIACGAYLQGPWEQMQLPLVLGASAVLANVVSLVLVNAARQLRSRPRDMQRLSNRERKKIEFMLGNVTNRDFSVVVMICAGLGWLHWFLALAAIGSWFFVMSMAWSRPNPSRGFPTRASPACRHSAPHDCGLWARSLGVASHIRSLCEECGVPATVCYPDGRGDRQCYHAGGLCGWGTPESLSPQTIWRADGRGVGVGYYGKNYNDVGAGVVYFAWARYGVLDYRRCQSLLDGHAGECGSSGIRGGPVYCVSTLRDWHGLFNHLTSLSNSSEMSRNPRTAIARTR